MNCIFQLSKENIGLAKEEVLALTRAKRHSLVGCLLFIDSCPKEVDELAKRLAYTSSIHRLLFSVPEKGLVKRLESYNWQSIYSKDFSLRIRNFAGRAVNYSEAGLAGYVWRKLKKPKVNLANPKTLIELLFTPEKVFCCLLLKSIKKGFSRRKPHMRPGFAPTSLSPKLARALVNLTGIKKGSLADPFCGTGGILIEAGLIGLKPAGYDIDAEALNKCRKNFAFCKIRNYRLLNADAVKINKKINHLATDLPYGRNTKVEGKIEDLYLSFLRMLKRNLLGSAVVVFPDFINYKKLIKKAGLNIKNEFTYYIHKSLTKRIAVLAR